MNDGLFKWAHGIASICETSLILVTTRIFSCQLGTARESFVTGIEQMVRKSVTDRSRSYQIAALRTVFNILYQQTISSYNSLFVS